MQEKQDWRKHYHIFANETDDFTTDLNKARKIFKEYKNEGFDCIRLYEEFELYENNEPTGDFKDGNCLQSIGDFPS